MRKPNKERSLAYMDSQLSKEWDYEKNQPLTPYGVFSHSRKKVWWTCKKCEQSYLSSIDNRSNGSGCPYCAGKRVWNGNCLATLNPKLAKEWHHKNGELTPFDVVLQSNKQINWICEKGHEYQSSVRERSTCNCNCSVCHSLGFKNPKLAKEWNFIKNGQLTPYDILPVSNKKVWWKCKKGHEWIASVADRNSGNGCPCCNKVELKDGTILDSLTEAHYYLKLKKEKVKFKCHIKIGLGKCSCDFYIPSTNRYIEVTGYNENWKYWEIYHKNILKKKQHIIKQLKADFEFVQMKLTTKQTQYVRNNSI